MRSRDREENRPPLRLLSVVIPARDEQGCIASTVEHLFVELRLHGVPHEIVVVDDASVDWSAGIATEHGARVLRIDSGPAANRVLACWMGARDVLSDWLLFVHPRAILEPAALDRVMRFVLDRKAEAVTVFPQQRCLTFWERVLLPFASQQRFAGLPFQRVNRLGDPIAVASGALLLVKREAYFRAGGHKDTASDDELASRLKRAGVVVVAARGERLGSTRMYRTFAELWAGVGTLHLSGRSILGAVLA